MVVRLTNQRTSLQPGEERGWYKGRHDPVHCAVYSPDGEMHVSGSHLRCRLRCRRPLCVVHVVPLPADTGLSAYMGYAHQGSLSGCVLFSPYCFPVACSPVTHGVRSLVSCGDARGVRQRGQHRNQWLHRERAQDH